LHDGNQIPQCSQGGKFRHNAAVFSVQLDLRGDGAGQTLPSRTTAALVSSQEVSRARTVMFIVAAVLADCRFSSEN